MVGAGYKWLLSPYGPGFFWPKNEHADKMRPGPFYWAAAEGAENFHSLAFENPKPARCSPRWGIAETSNYFNFAPMDASLEVVLPVGPATGYAHHPTLIDLLFA